MLLSLTLGLGSVDALAEPEGLPEADTPGSGLSSWLDAGAVGVGTGGVTQSHSGVVTGGRRAVGRWGILSGMSAFVGLVGVSAAAVVLGRAGFRPAAGPILSLAGEVSASTGVSTGGGAGAASG